MTKYDYRRAMIEDIKNWIINTNWVHENYNPDYYQMLDALYEELWDKDEITGNGGNYYSTYDNCLTYVSENLQLFMEAYTALNLGDQGEWKNNVPQRADCTIRCYLLRDCLEEACNEL